MVIDGRFKDFDHFLDNITSSPDNFQVYHLTVYWKSFHSALRFERNILTNLERLFGTSAPIFEIGGVLYRIDFPEFYESLTEISKLVLVPL
jgi:hypothetical protein